MKEGDIQNKGRGGWAEWRRGMGECDRESERTEKESERENSSTQNREREGRDTLEKVMEKKKEDASNI